MMKQGTVISKAGLSNKSSAEPLVEVVRNGHFTGGRSAKDGKAEKEKSALPVIPDTPMVIRINLLAGNRHTYETDPQVLFCNDYLRMGLNRSISGLRRLYVKSMPEPPPLNTLYHYSWDYGWAIRANIYDARMESEKDKVAIEILHTGLAESNARVRELKRMAELLAEEIARPGRLYLHDVKQIGSGKFARRVKLLRFNSPLVEQYRGVLDDIAKEVGGRKGSSDHGPVSISVRLKGLNEPVLSDEELLESDKVKVIRGGFKPKKAIKVAHNAVS